ncbi:MAG: maleylacetoacetate isomerase [Sphingobium sp.]|nr:maleylacetoacetate isomerase [Sphingobium sp.]
MPRTDRARVTGEPRLVLHDYARSSAAYRVRIALNLKGLAYEQVSHDLRAGEQRALDYLALNPQGLVPALDTGSGIIAQSGAIMEWLEERYPQKPLLPSDAGGRAIVRSMAQIIACDIHPLNNLRVQIYLRDKFTADDAQMSDWIATWMREGFAAVEELIACHGGQFAFGDSPTMADCYLVPQVYSANRYNVALDAWPRMTAVASRTAALEPVQRAHPDRNKA